MALPLLDDYFFGPHPVPYQPPSGFYIHKDCLRRPGAPPYLYTGGNIGPAIRTFGTKTTAGDTCPSGQSVASALYVNQGIANVATNTSAIILYDVGRNQTDTLRRGRVDLVYWRDTPTTTPTQYYTSPYTVFPNPMADPNLLRVTPGTPVPSLAPAPAPPEPFGDRPWQWYTPGPPGARPPSAHVRERPRGRDQHNKNMSRAARIGVWLWNMLDTVSELSEIGGAFWDALPEEIRDRYNCADGTSFGQYGLDISTCKASAIINHFGEIDALEAFKNLAKNIVEDMTIGQFHKFLDRLYPRGVSFQKTAATHALSELDPEAYIAARLKELWEFLGI